MVYSKEKFADRLIELCNEAGLSIDINGEAVNKLHVICSRLDECSKKFNLTAISEPEEVLKKHITDSLFFAEAVKELGALNVIDIGSGAGFPSLPTAAALPNVEVTALDSTAKKTVYMRETADAAGIENFKSIAARSEDAARGEYRESYDCAGARAVARLPVLMELCTPFVKVGGYFVAMKGAAAKEEISEAKTAASKLGCKLQECRQYSLPGMDDARFLLIYQKDSAAKPEYPRNFSQITKKPL